VLVEEVRLPASEVGLDLDLDWRVLEEEDEALRFGLVTVLSFGFGGGGINSLSLFFKSEGLLSSVFLLAGSGVDEGVEVGGVAGSGLAVSFAGGLGVSFLSFLCSSCGGIGRSSSFPFPSVVARESTPGEDFAAAQSRTLVLEIESGLVLISPVSSRGAKL